VDSGGGSGGSAARGKAPAYQSNNKKRGRREIKGASNGGRSAKGKGPVKNTFGNVLTRMPNPTTPDLTRLSGAQGQKKGRRKKKEAPGSKQQKVGRKGGAICGKKRRASNRQTIADSMRGRASREEEGPKMHTDEKGL